MKLDRILSLRYFGLLMALSFGLLMFLGWPMSPVPIPLFIGIVPLLLSEQKLHENRSRKQFFRYWGTLYLGFLIWNVSTTWWVINASMVGGIAAFTINSLLMTIPFLLYTFTRKAAGVVFGLISLVFFWLTFEHIHLNWDMSWPWLNLGNGLAMYPWLIQWYSYTGTGGGTLWIWMVNCLVFLSILRPERAKVYTVRIASIILIPFLISVIMYNSYEDVGEEEIEIVVLQPNIDPYSEKFADAENFIPFPEQIRRFIELSESQISTETDFVVWPETAIDKWIQESNLSSDTDIQRILQFKSNHPNITLVTGLTSYTIYGKDKKTQTARYNETLGYYDSFNTAFWIDNASRELYHKSKLVPGVEIMPYPFLFNFLIELIFDLGGTTGGYGKQDERTVFRTPDGIGVAPSICYESIYGDFMSIYVRNGAGVIFIITNDGWWGDTPGYHQHMQYATMRAIETRRGIARSANTGISGFINQRGDIIEATNYWVQDVRRNTLKVNSEITFYAAYGDYISRTASWLSVFLILGAIVKLRKKK